MHTPEGFTELLLLLLIAVGAAAVFLRLRLPAVLGYLAVGIAAGPSTLALIEDTETIRSLTELGVVLLLFTIGLEFSLPTLARMRGALLGLGGGEVGIAAAVTGVVALLLGIGGPGAVVLAGVVAMSSTALVTKQLHDQGELGAAHGRAALGIVLFQDLAVVPFLVVVSGLSGDGGGNLALALAKSLGLGLVAIAGIVLVGRYVLTRALHTVAALHSGELFTLTALTLALGAAWWTAELGLSPALGAFVAGLMLGESPFRHTIEAEIRPFRDVLLALFFVSVGMLLDLSIFAIGWPWILLLFSALVVFKLVLIAGLCLLARMPVRDSLRTALVLAHGGEFGFALLTLGLSQGLLPPDYGQVVLAALLLSMAAAPLALRFNDTLATWLMAGGGGAARGAAAAPEIDPADRVVIVGFGHVAQHIARLLDDAGIPWLALDDDPVRVENARAAGSPVMHGDGSRFEVLHAAGIERARALVLTGEHPGALAPAVRRARAALPQLTILVSARDDGHWETLSEAGATEVIPETLEAGLMLASHLLLLLGVDRARVDERVRRIRHDRYRLLRAVYPGSSDPAGDDVQRRAVALPDDAYAVDRRLDAVDLGGAGASLVGLVRDGTQWEAPPGDTVIRRGDVLVIAGAPAALDHAEAHLVRG